MEDEPDLGDRLARTLEAAGFEVERVEGAEEAAAGIEKRRPDLALVDCLLPGFAAFRLCRRVHARPDTVRLPIILFTGRDGALEWPSGFRADADDWICRPCPAPELIRRVRAMLERTRADPGMRLLDHGGVRLDSAAHRVFRGEREVHLSPTEFRLLRHFLEHPGRVFSRRQLLDCVWGAGTPDSRTVDATVYRLRRALNADGEPDLLRTVRTKGHLPTVRAKGYALACEPGARPEPAPDGRARPAALRAPLSPRMPVTDELWRCIEPLLPPRPARGNGRPILTDRAALAGILFVLQSGMDWTTLPKELGCGSGATCRERLRLWKNAGIWDRISVVLGEEGSLLLREVDVNSENKTDPLSARTTLGSEA